MINSGANTADASWSCACSPGVEGRLCDKNRCYSNPCFNGGDCVFDFHHGNSYECECKGTFSEIVIQ